RCLCVHYELFTCPKMCTVFILIRVDGSWEGNVRAKKWSDQEGTAHQGCKGHYVRDICVYGMGDIEWIINNNNMFANKFESNAYPEALDCLEQWHRSKVLNQANIPVQPSYFDSYLN
uniref:Glucosaminyl (N-acetyl) transferase family member 7 n=1 Tax=Oryzias latipes TaxID=8090 RepID=A0A3P9J8A6_ORYLA